MQYSTVRYDAVGLKEAVRYGAVRYGNASGINPIEILSNFGLEIV